MAQWLILDAGELSAFFLGAGKSGCCRNLSIGSRIIADSL